MPVYYYNGPGELDVVIARGVPWSMPFAYQAGDPLVAVDITGWTVLFEIASSSDFSAAAILAPTATITNAVSGQITLQLTTVQIAGLTQPKLFYRVKLTPPSADAFYILCGGLSFR